MKIEIYTKDACAMCTQAKSLMQSKGWDYTERYISPANRDEVIGELTNRLGQTPRTVPQIFINDTPVGGYDNLLRWISSNNA